MCRLIRVSRLFLSTVVFLTGCSTIQSTPVSEFLNNREQFIRKEYDLVKIPAAIKSPVEAAFFSEKKYSKMVLVSEITSVEDGKSQVTKATQTMYGVGNGCALM